MVSRFFKYFFILLFTGGFIWTIYFFYTKSKKPPVVYEQITPFDTLIIKKTVATGSIIPRREINVKSQVSGIIDKLYVVAGQEVKQGDVIARIKIIPNMLTLANAETRTRQAQINYDNAKAEFDRSQQLFKGNVIAKAEFQPIELKLKSTQEELNAAENNEQLIKEGVTKSAGTATNTLIRSTITGMILDVPNKEGSSVIESNTFNEGTTIASVANMGEMIFEGKVDESEVGKIEQGMNLILTIGAIDKESFPAKLEYISPKGVTENGAIQFMIRAALDKTNGTFLRAGYSANADIILAKKENAFAIPERVLQFEKDKTYVELETGKNIYTKQYIKTGLSDGVNIEVTEGLKKGDHIKVPQMNDLSKSS
jgi:HlyD family secretion protein